MLAEQGPEGLAERVCPDFGEPELTSPPRVEDRQVAIVSTAGLIHRGDRPFGLGAVDYRVIDRDDPADLVMTHISTNFDRSGFIQDHEVVFPLRRLSELAESSEQREIGSVGRFHYSFMGATDPQAMAPAVKQLAQTLRGDGTNVVLLVPV
jgi:D-proline reductase (dithiol) PrdB